MKDWANEMVECELLLSNGMTVIKMIPLRAAMFLDSPPTESSVTIKISAKVLGELFEDIGIDVSKKV